MWQRIISEMPEHDVYIEPFWGRGTIAKRKRPARYTIGVDLDPSAISSGDGHTLMFRADGVQWLADYFKLLPPEDPAAAVGDAEFSGVNRVAEFSGARAETGDCTFGGVAWGRHFVYLDPPYLGCGGYYRHELTEQRRRVLCRLFRRLPCPAALSGYRTNVYAEELRGCRSITIPTVNRAGKRVNEIVWMNYEVPRRYHDVRFIGQCRRQRERIRRRVKTWSEGLRRMPVAERQAVYEGLAGRDAESGGGRPPRDSPASEATANEREFTLMTGCDQGVTGG